MNKTKYMKWYLKLCNEEYNGNTNELDSAIKLVEDNQMYM